MGKDVRPRPRPYISSELALQMAWFISGSLRTGGLATDFQCGLSTILNTGMAGEQFKSRRVPNRVTRPCSPCLRPLSPHCTPLRNLTIRDSRVLNHMVQVGCVSDDATVQPHHHSYALRYHDWGLG